LLEQKETKIQGERPTPICPAKAQLNGGSHSLFLSIYCAIGMNECFAIRQNQPHYYQRMQLRKQNLSA
jgi:hypothetical protein